MELLNQVIITPALIETYLCYVFSEPDLPRVTYTRDSGFLADRYLSPTDRYHINGPITGFTATHNNAGSISAFKVWNENCSQISNLRWIRCWPNCYVVKFLNFMIRNWCKIWNLRCIFAKFIKRDSNTATKFDRQTISILRYVSNLHWTSCWPRKTLNRDLTVF